MSANPSPASSRRSASSWSHTRPARRAAAATAALVSSAVAAEVTRSTRSCASSTTTRSCSGRTWKPCSASMASSAWLVTMRSARPASARAFSAKQSVPIGQRLTAQALAARHGHLAPGVLGDAGDELVAVAGLGVGDPLAQPLDLTAHRGDRERVEQGGVVGLVLHAGVELVEAQVVAAALEDGERRLAAERASRAPSPAGAGRGRRAGAAARWWPSRSRPWPRARRRAAGRGRGRRGTCRCRCRPARRCGHPCGWPWPRPRPWPPDLVVRCRPPRPPPPSGGRTRSGARRRIGAQPNGTSAHCQSRAGTRATRSGCPYFSTGWQAVWRLARGPGETVLSGS